MKKIIIVDGGNVTPEIMKRCKKEFGENVVVLTPEEAKITSEELEMISRHIETPPPIETFGFEYAPPPKPIRNKEQEKLRSKNFRK